MQLCLTRRLQTIKIKVHYTLNYVYIADYIQLLRKRQKNKDASVEEEKTKDSQEFLTTNEEDGAFVETNR